MSFDSDNPYATPVMDATAQEALEPTPATALKKIMARGVFSIVFLMLYAMCNFTWLLLAHLGLVAEDYSNLSDNPFLGLISWICAVSALVFYIATILCFLMWTYRTAENAKQIYGATSTYSPALSAGSYFIPILNFVMPYKALRQAADNTFLHTCRKAPLFMLPWWLCWVAGNILSRIDEGPCAFISGCLHLAAALLLSVIIFRISRRQANMPASALRNEESVPLPRLHGVRPYSGPAPRTSTKIVPSPPVAAAVQPVASAPEGQE